jgi:hypothetical protein
MRRGELAGFCFDKILFNRNLIEVSRTRDRYGLRDTTKNGKIRYVPMNSIVKRTLESRRLVPYSGRKLFARISSVAFDESILPN